MWFFKNKKLDTIIQMLTDIQGKEKQIMADLTKLTTSVGVVETEDQAVIDELTALEAEIKDLQGQIASAPDQAAIDALQARLDAANQKLTAAVAAAQTPAA